LNSPGDYATHNFHTLHDATLNGEKVDLMASPALVAGIKDGVITYRRKGSSAELLSLDAAILGQGIGTGLVRELITRLGVQGVCRLWVTTTNDNLSALRFYQSRGFRLMRLRPNAVEQARQIKPSIPLVGEHGIPIRDELDLCFCLATDGSFNTL